MILLTKKQIKCYNTWCSSWSGRVGGRASTSPSWTEAARLIENMRRRKERAVAGSSGPAPGFISNLLARMDCILSRSEGEQRDCEIVTRSLGSGTEIGWDDVGPPAWSSCCLACCSSWWRRNCVHAKWKAATAMHDRCFGWAWKRNVTKSYNQVE